MELITSLRVVNANGHATAELRRREAAALFFSARDSFATAKYSPIRPEATRVWYRPSGTGEWKPLTAVQQLEDPTIGYVYRVDLSSATDTTVETGDLKIDLQDAAGNQTTWTLEPAFSMVDIPVRRRAVR